MTVEKMNKAAFARRVGVSRMTVHRWAKSGRIPCENGKIPVDAADSTLGIMGNGSAPSRPGEDLQRARCFHEIWRAKRARLDYEKLVANILDADDVKQAMKCLGSILAHEVDKLESHTGILTKIAKTGSLKEMKAELKNISRGLRQSITDALTGDATAHQQTAKGT